MKVCKCCNTLTASNRIINVASKHSGFDKQEVCETCYNETILPKIATIKGYWQRCFDRAAKYKVMVAQGAIDPTATTRIILCKTGDKVIL